MTVAQRALEIMIVAVLVVTGADYGTQHNFALCQLKHTFGCAELPVRVPDVPRMWSCDIAVYCRYSGAAGSVSNITTVLSMQVCCKLIATLT